MSNHLVEKAVRYGGAAKKLEPTNQPLCTTCRLEVDGWIVEDCNIAKYCLWQPASPMELQMNLFLLKSASLVQVSPIACRLLWYSCSQVFLLRK